jgi:hypothetical protein
MKRKILRLITILSIFLLLIFTDVLYGSILRKLSLEEIISNSDLIIVGKCEKTETVWLDKKIYTIATIVVNQSVKGKAVIGDKIQVYILGGRVKEPVPVKMQVPGAATIEKEEEMILFLESRGDKKQFHYPVGMAQGKISISTDPKTGEKIVHYAEPIKGVKWVDSKGQPLSPSKPGAISEPAKEGSLEGFIGRIQKIMTEQEKGGAK